MSRGSLNGLGLEPKEVLSAPKVSLPHLDMHLASCLQPQIRPVKMWLLRNCLGSTWNRKEGRFSELRGDERWASISKVRSNLDLASVRTLGIETFLGIGKGDAFEWEHVVQSFWREKQIGQSRNGGKNSLQTA